MAKSANRGGGEGTRDRGGVRSTLDSPFKNSDKGPQQTMSAPFNAPRSGGDNGLPQRLYDDMGGPKAGPAANGVSSLGTIRTNPRQPRRG